MYIRKTNRTTHKKYSIDEKNQIVLLYLDRHMGVAEIVRRYDISKDTTLYRWVNQYKQYGTCVDNRGKCSKLQNPKKGRPRKTPEKTLEECSKEELIIRCRMLEDIKKSLAYLESQKQKKNIK
ncbi:MAG: transposase [Bacilli bacterium]|nr:transposase [Bacilli bacterium]